MDYCADTEYCQGVTWDYGTVAPGGEHVGYACLLKWGVDYEHDQSDSVDAARLQDSSLVPVFLL